MESICKLEETLPDRSAPDPDEESTWRQEITTRLDKFCRERGFQRSPSQSHLIADLVQMKKRWGDYYCPCQTERSPETICVCTAVVDGLVDVMGACFCQLVIGDSTS